jgi:hypothetical protein
MYGLRNGSDGSRMAARLRTIAAICLSMAESLLTVMLGIVKVPRGRYLPKPLSDLHAEVTLRLSKTITLMATFTRTIVRSRRKPK